MKQKKQFFALLLTGIMLFSSIPVHIFATGTQDNDTLCEHHPEHTAECGYREAVTGSPCTHEHTEECFLTTEKCLHQHTEACYPAEETKENAEAEPSACTHTCSMENGCVTQVTDCPHERGEHTEECGFAEEVAAAPCTYVCELCRQQDSEEPIVEWTKAPETPGAGAPDLEDGQVTDEIYGQPASPVTMEEYRNLQQQALAAPIQEEPGKELSDDEIDGPITFIYINGEAYTGGDIEAMEGDNFSYFVSWAPNHEEGTPDVLDWPEGSWFEALLFTVPGLNFSNSPQIPLNIDGIKVGEYSLTYNKDTGEMTYKVVFNRYIQFFQPSTIAAYLQGSGKFSGTLEDRPIGNGSATGSITVNPRPEVPTVPSGPGGTGWQPSKAPGFSDSIYPFGKGVKWNSSGAHGAHPEIEWRVVFLEQLQKVQRDFLDNEDWTPPESEGYVIIEDTLDVNQRFYVPTFPHDKAKYGDAPFFLEVPVIVPGTGKILNNVQGVGNGNYDGPGEIYTQFKGTEFQEIPGENASTAAEITEVKDKVRNTPFTWTVTTDPDTKRQTLLINAGKLGTTDPTQGITWDKIDPSNGWPEKGLEKEIAYCDNKINALKTGQDSPIALFHQRSNQLLNVLNTAVNLPANAANKEELKRQVADWNSDYFEWYNDPRISYLEPLAKLDEATGEWKLIRELPKKALIETLAEMVAKSDGTKLKNTGEYKNYMISLDNLQKDQRVYLENRLEVYGKDWENAKQYYQKALDFYRHNGVYGFVVKVRTESVNNSAGSYSNDVNIWLNNKRWSASDESTIRFAGGITGSYNLGDIVLQKADKFYDSGDDLKDIQQVEKDGTGLAGAQFEMYCGNDNIGTPPAIGRDNLAHFLDKAASINGKTYRYAHTGDDHPQGIIPGDISTLTTDSDGKLALSNIAQGHNHWLREIQAPAGYYRNPELTMIEDEDAGNVIFQLIPNVSRSIYLKKIDSFSKLPVEGAEFTLYKKNGQGKEETVTGFSIRDLNGHEGYWQDVKGKETLKTNAEGELCVHGLDAGDYVLRETKAAPGYILPAAPDPIPEYHFTLEEDLPENPDGVSGADHYDDDYHYMLTNPDLPLTNTPGTASLTLTKTDVAKKPLGNAAFALFRFTGTEADWRADPDDGNMWEAVPVRDYNNDTIDSPYFKTKNEFKDITLNGDFQSGGSWDGKRVQAVLTDNKETDAKGKFSITDIPVGHYSIAEVETSDPIYTRDSRSFYFTVNGDSVGKDLQLYTAPEQKEEQKLTDNRLVNYTKQAQIAMVKYDKDENPPKVEGEKLENRDGWQYTDNVLENPTPNPEMEGAVFKLFMRRGASTGRVNPDPLETTTEGLQGPRPERGYDTCLAVGTTDENGLLKLSEMTTRGNPPDNTMAGRGLNPEEYYMMEVKAPEGYLLDQTPIHFSLDGEVFEATADDRDATPGLVMMMGNTKADYGIRLTKVDKETVGAGKTPVRLAGAEFEVKEKDGTDLLYFTGANGVYRKAESTDQGAVSTVATGEDGSLTITGLAGDTTYTLTETKAPRGYKLPEDEALRVTEITTPASAGDGLQENGVLFPKGETQVKNERLMGKVTLHKQAAETGDALKGAKFELYETIVEVIPPGDPAFDPTNPEGTRSHDELIAFGWTDENGDLTFNDLPWSKFYYIIETEAPEGYLLDQTKRMFSIDENSFDADGQAIPIEYPALVNTKGTLGEALLVKVDADNPDKKLADAHFYLEKYWGLDANKNELWLGYGQGMYYTDTNGEIPFLLPPGKYKLTEMKAPDGYILDASKTLFFTITETQAGSPPKVEYFDEDGKLQLDKDGKPQKYGKVTNREGETGVLLKKTIEGTAIPVKGATFRIYWDFYDENMQHVTEDLYFIHNGGGNYEYTENHNAPGATKELKTNSNGEIFIILPESFTEGFPPNYPDAVLPSLMYVETDAPDAIDLPVEEAKRSGSLTPLHENIFKEVPVGNKLSAEAMQDLTITVQKSDGKSRLGLPGAKFELYDILKLDNEVFPILVATGTTDLHGELTFEKDVQGNPLNLILGATYYLLEREAPEGYVRDETIHEITIDERHMDENLYFEPITLSIPNYQVSGSVRLKKVAAEDMTEGLAGAEFELLRKSEDIHSEIMWEHYGPERYVTDENGELLIENLPYGSYVLIERTAPLGYLVGDPTPSLPFLIETEGQEVDLGYITNEIDPNPVRDVQVKKVAAEDNDKLLPGAEFELYQQKEDGSGYYLRQQKTYVTDSAGSFMIERLPVGRYALKEIKAPAGYEVPEEDMTYFTVRVDERMVKLEIENARSEDGESNTTSLTVEKVWEDNGGANRPDSVSVQLYRNGVVHGNPVELNEENGWIYTWESLDSGASWVVDEVDIPEGYEKSISRRGNIWTITNRARPGTPMDPENPPSSSVPQDSNSQDSNSQSADSLNSGQTTLHAPRTGDQAQLILWLLLTCISVCGIVRSRCRYRTKK